MLLELRRSKRNSQPDVLLNKSKKNYAVDHNIMLYNTGNWYVLYSMVRQKYYYHSFLSLAFRSSLLRILEPEVPPFFCQKGNYETHKSMCTLIKEQLILQINKMVSSYCGAGIYVCTVFSNNLDQIPFTNGTFHT